MSLIRPVAFAAMLAGSLVGANAAQANTYNLTQDNCTGGCSTGVTPFGTVQVLQSGADLAFTVSLNSPYIFNKSTGMDAFVFGISGGTSADIQSLSSGFSIDTTLPQHEDGFGDFLFGITKAATGGASLTFTFLNAVITDLVFSTGNGITPVLFAADIVGKNGNTGPVGGSTCIDCGGGAPPPAVPLPGALPLFATGLAGLGVFRWRRKRKAAIEAVA